MEPLIPELDEEENPELKDFSKRFWWSLPLTVAVTLLAMAGHAIPLFHGASQNWVELALTTPVVLWAGWPFFVRGFASVKHRSPNMWTLIGLGTGAAYIYSIVATVLPSIFPESFTVGGRIGGVLNSLDVREGMTVSTGASLARVNGLEKVWLEVAVPEAQVANVAPGQLVNARLPAFAGEVLEGTIQAVLPQANLDSRTVRVRVELPNPQQRLRPGMTAEVTLSRNVEDVLVIPSEAVIRTGRRALVMLAEDQGRYRPIEVRTGREFDDQTEVLEGLEAGQKVVASGQFLLDSEASLRGLTAQGLEEPATSTEPALHEAEGTIVSLEDGMVGLSHGPFKTLNMPGMTMSFPVADQSLLSGLQVDDRVRVGVRESEEGLVIEHIEKLGGQP